MLTNMIERLFVLWVITFLKFHYDESCYYELNAILNDDSFQEMVYNVMSSKIIQNYYTIKEEKEDRIIKGYKDLLLI